jgi:5-methylthioadenosine/S-adenosylhomocysteine deaminase
VSQNRGSGEPGQRTGARTVIKGGLVLDVGDASGAAIRSDVLIDGDRITSVRPMIESGPTDLVIDARDRIVIPGLVNAHLHSWEALFRGRYEGLPLELWGLYAYPFLRVEPLPARLIWLRTLLVAIESLKNGVTYLLDDVLQIQGQELEGLTAVFQAYRDIGLRANVSLRMVDRPWLETIPFAKETLPRDLWAQATAQSPATAEYFRDICEAAFARLHRPAEGMRFVVAPSAPQRCTPELLQQSAELAKTHDTAFHIHLLETRLQALAGKVFFGKSLVDYLNDLGVLTSRTTLAHAIWISDSDIETISNAAATVVHNPVSNLKLGSGVLPYAKLRRAGVNLALGTDGISSNDSARMFEVMKFAALLHTLTDPDIEQWPRAAEILTAATLGGSRSLALPDVGAIAPGQKADLVLLDANTSTFTPLNDLARHLVYSENGSSVRTVLVGGRIVMDAGRCLAIDEEAVMSEARELSQDFLFRHAASEKAHAAYEPYFKAVYERSQRESL